MKNKTALLGLMAMAMATDMRFSSQVSEETLKRENTFQLNRK